jgi:hypothetical protein
VTTSASVTIRRAFPGRSGRRSSAVQNTAMSSRSRSASIEALPWVGGRHYRAPPTSTLLLMSPSYRLAHSEPWKRLI